MALKNPTPPTPPTPPAIDKGDGENNHAVIDAKQLLGIRKENSVSGDEYIDEEIIEENPPAVPEKKITTPETMARDAVANGGGALTKRTVEKPTEETPKPAPGINFAITEDDRGKAALREFQTEDKKNNFEQKSSAVETPRTVKLGQHESYSGFYWVFTIIISIVAAVFFVKKFLLTDKPKLKKSDLFNGAKEKTSKPIAKLPQKKSDEPTKHFEVRV